jgi:outer membrane receptor protein involved in Fe transport
MKKLAFIFSLLLTTAAFAQTKVSGTVVGEDNSPIPGANIIIVGKSVGAVSDFDGNFVLNTSENPPFNISVSSVGYTPKTITISSNDSEITVVLNEADNQLDEIVISASRTPERLFESPVSVERFGLKEIRNTSSADFYDGLVNLKGVDINTNSLTFKSINTRGFATFSNTRFMQLVDGMDNSSPALNFVLGNLVGMNDLDVLSVEILPGASSALYGANAFNGILFMRSKSPFDFEGVSTYVKTGVTSQEAAGTNQFYDVGIRAAKKLSDKFAIKLNLAYMQGEDWHANRTDDLGNPGSTRVDPGYNGLNVYGDEVATTLNFDQLAGLPSGTVGGNTLISRTGYAEEDLTTHDAQSYKYDLAMHWRPTGGDLEVIFNSRTGKGATIYQGSNRYYINDFRLSQNKIEIKDNNFFVRAYMTTEDAGKSYDTRFAAINTNRYWKGDTQWFTDYATAFIGARLGIGTGMPLAEDVSHAMARSYADNGRLIPGTSAFDDAFNKIIADGDLTTGAKFIDETQLTHVDANYNLSYLTSEVMDIQIGGSYREYRLNSHGTIFTDNDGAIPYKEYGLYTQVQKVMSDERLKLTGSVRYDKNELFDGFVSPRGSFAYTFGENRNNNFRASFQTGFRNPTTQDLYIGLDAGLARLVGSAADNLDRYSFSTPVSAAGAPYAGGSNVTLTGRDAYENAFSAASVLSGAPVKANTTLVKPEQVTAFEVGYRGQFDAFVIDLSAYYNQYQDFISNSTVLVPKYGTVGDNTLSLLALMNGDYQPFQAYTNSKADISSYGINVGIDTRFDDFDFGFSYTFADFDFDQSSDPDFRPGFNTPKHKFKAYLGSTHVTDNVGFNINYRWADTYYWQASFADGDIPSFSVLDAQVNYRIPDSKKVLKVGAANVFNEEYYSAIGTGSVGAQYYISLMINN